jgi:hypothetical protein
MMCGGVHYHNLQSCVLLLCARVADWESATLQDLGSESGTATRKLMQNLVTCMVQANLTKLVSAGSWGWAHTAEQ